MAGESSGNYRSFENLGSVGLPLTMGKKQSDAKTIRKKHFSLLLSSVLILLGAL